MKISVRAANEMHKAATWWEENRPAAPGAISADVEAALELLAAQPEIGNHYAGARTPGVRRLYLGRVGYFIYYRVLSDELRVLTFWHASRGRQPKL